MRYELAIVAVTTALFGLWLMVGSSVFLKPGEITYRQEGDGFVAHWTRETPRRGVWAKWITECRSLEEGIERRADGVAPYQHRSDPVEYALQEPIARCFEDGLPVQVTHKWQVLLFNWLPLRPMVREYTVVAFAPTGE